MEGAKKRKMPGNLHQSVKNAFLIFMVTNVRNGSLFVEPKTRNYNVSLNCQDPCSIYVWPKMPYCGLQNP